VTDGDAAAARPETAFLMLAGTGGPDEGEAVTVRVRHEWAYVLVTVASTLDEALGMLASAAKAEAV
jgi:hypothetical protein